MADREKVIKGLKTCRTRVHCKECPYAYDKRSYDSYCEAVLHNDVLELIKEQENYIPVSWLEQYTRLKCTESWHNMANAIIKTWQETNKKSK